MQRYSDAGDADGGEAGEANDRWLDPRARVQKNEAAKRLRYQVDERFKRMLRLWAPSLLWSALARGDVDAIVLYDSEGDDLYSGILLAEEAGIAVTDFKGVPFTGMCPEPYIVAAHPANLETVLQAVWEITG